MMSRKRAPGPYSYDDDEDYVPSKGVKYSEREDMLPPKVKKHTLDSDEEDDDVDNAIDDDDDDDEGDINKKYNMLRDEDIDGQEEGTVDFEGEHQITPFNVKEEMEDGHFDGDGFYYFKKNANQIKDAWLDDIDWVKVKHREGDEKKYGSDVESDTGSDDLDPATIKTEAEKNIRVYTEILSFLKQGETIAKALKRLGGNKKISSAQKWKLKKSGSLGTENGNTNMADLMRLTELANKLVEAGNMDVYQETYEMINLKIERSKAPPPEPSMDMFAEGGDEKSETANDEKKTQGSSSHAGSAAADSIGQVQWELRWENEDNAEIHGPFNTEKMLQWQESGYFSKGGYVRKTTEQGQAWYSTRRIDFDLYT